MSAARNLKPFERRSRSSTANIDKTTQGTDYSSLPSIQDYLIIDPDDGAVLPLWRGKGDKIARKLRHSGKLTLDPPSLSVEVGALIRLDTER